MSAKRIGNGSVDDYIDGLEFWADEVRKLRSVLGKTQLEETVKWGMPCYTWSGKNVVGIGAFKNYFGLWFHQGALLGDPDGLLTNAQEGKTKALRQWRMTRASDIDATTIKRFVTETMKLIDAGQVIRPDRRKALEVPAELNKELATKPALNDRFNALSLGRQREFCDHIASAVRPATREARLRKCLPKIMRGEGLNDKYRR